MSGFRAEEWSKTVYMAHGGTGDGSSAAQPLPLANGTIFTIPAGVVVSEGVFVVTTALTTLSAPIIGFSGTTNAFMLNNDVTVGTKGAYGMNGASIDADSQYYSEVATPVLYAQTSSSGSGAAVVVMKGHKIL